MDAKTGLLHPHPLAQLIHQYLQLWTIIMSKSIVEDTDLYTSQSQRLTPDHVHLNSRTVKIMLLRYRGIETLRPGRAKKVSLSS